VALPHKTRARSEGFGNASERAARDTAQFVPSGPAIATLLALVLVFALGAGVVDARSCGDPDASGNVTMTDGVSALRAAAGLASNCAPEVCDVDGDGIVSVTDGVTVLRAAAGLDATLRCRALSFVEAEFGGIGGIPGLFSVNHLTVSPDGVHVYVTGQDERGFRAALTVLRRGGATGALTFVETQVDGLAPADGDFTAGGVAVSPDGAYVYVTRIEITSPPRDAVVVFRRDATTGQLALVEAHVEPFGGADGLFPAKDLALSPDGAHVYVASGARPDAPGDSIVVFRRDLATGVLTLVETQFDGVAGVIGLAQSARVVVSPDGMHVYSSGEESIPGGRLAPGITIVTFARNQTTGALRFVGREFTGRFANPIVAIGGVLDMAFSPDGADLYAAVVDGLGDESAVMVYRRDVSSGTLSLVASERSHVDVISGRDVPQAITVSHDGARVYLASRNPLSGAVAVFRRDAQTGAISFVEAEQNGVGRVEGVALPGDLAESPDGNDVYVTGYDPTRLIGAATTFEVVR
jgi:DNA-binding beta-propeller fold protein YncE